MEMIAKFEKVSFEQFKKDAEKIFKEKYSADDLKEIYKNISLPVRATSGSAGYDFKTPFKIESVKMIPDIIPTGIRAKIEDGWMLKLYPRSGTGFKYGLRLLNTVGIIDSDYYYSDNEGHIMTKIEHTSGDYFLEINQGESFIQGVFEKYGITEDDDAHNTRNGGFGSTGK